MKIKQTLKEYKCAVFSIGCAASIPLIIFLSTFMEARCQAPESTSSTMVRCGHFFINWLYDFQTLIAGCFALIAAAWTVRTMNSNTKQMTERRKADLIDNAQKLFNNFSEKIDELNEQIKTEMSVATVNGDSYKSVVNIISTLRIIQINCGYAEKIGIDFYVGSFIPFKIKLNEQVELLTKIITKDFSSLDKKRLNVILGHIQSVTEKSREEYVKPLAEFAGKIVL